MKSKQIKLINKAGVKDFIKNYPHIKFKARITKPALKELNEKVEEIIIYCLNQIEEDERTTIMERDILGY